MSIDGTIEDFIDTGRLGSLFVGGSAASVSCHVGLAGDTTRASRRSKAFIFKTGPLEVTYGRDVVRMIFAYPSRLPSELPAVPLNMLCHSLERLPSNYEQANEYLLGRGIRLQPDSSLTFDDQLALRSASGVSLIFADRGQSLEKVGIA